MQKQNCEEMMAVMAKVGTILLSERGNHRELTYFNFPQEKLK